LIGEPTTRSGVQAGVIVFFYINWRPDRFKRFDFHPHHD
jgi:hypothetical protein